MGQYQIFVQYQYQYFLKFGFQNQYQYQNSSKSFFNIKINIKIKISPNSISKSISKFFHIKIQYQNQCQYFQNIDIDFENQTFFGLKVCCLTSCDFCFAWDTNTHCIMSNGIGSETHGTSPETLHLTYNS